MAWDTTKEHAYQVEVERLAKAKEERNVALHKIHEAFSLVGLVTRLPNDVPSMLPALPPRPNTVTVEEIAAIAGRIRDALAPFDIEVRPAKVREHWEGPGKDMRPPAPHVPFSDDVR